MIYNRKRKNIMDPKRISEYNNFLSTLDKNSLNHYKLFDDNSDKEENKPEIKEPLEGKDNPNAKETDDIIKSTIKHEIELIIQRINATFSLYNYHSSIFNGEQPQDKILTNGDPNYYMDDSNNTKDGPHHYPKKQKNTSPSNREVKIKETINISAEINNISDILKLTETYKLDPDIQYNINMKMLHDIKEPLIELNNMIGMKNIKNNIVDQILYFSQSLHKNEKANHDFMHTVIYGPPGTGKTEIAKIMGKIYSNMGVLTNGTFKKVTRSDLIAGYLGQTAMKTRDVVKDAIGGVLFIDEAYALGSNEKRDSFAKECVDTLCEALSDNKDNLMVIIAGYEKELKDCFFSLNQGLDSRFTWRFKIDEYTAQDLYDIFLNKIQGIGWEIKENSKVSVDWFTRNKDYFKFYGRDIETLISKTKIAHSRRVFCESECEKRKIILKDLDKGFDMYLKNEDVKNRKDETEMRKILYNTLYS